MADKKTPEIRCRSCREFKFEHEFYRSKKAASGRRGSCKECEGEAVARRRNIKGDTPSGDFSDWVGPGHVLKNQTIQIKDGVEVQRWMKNGIGPGDKIDMLYDALNALDTPFKSRSEPSAAITMAPDGADLLDVHVMGDPHLGLHVWGAEAGDNFDLEIGVNNLKGAIDTLVEGSSGAHTALLVNVGDFFHADTKHSTTTAGTYVDTDTRLRKVFENGIRFQHWAIARLLTRYKKVLVATTPGNHDWLTGSMMAVHLGIYYENNPRVQVDTSPSKFLWHEFGKNLIGITHGDRIKIPDLQGVMSVDQCQAWARTTERWWITGHIHHLSVKELHGCVVESFRTLAAGDAWHHASGYRSGRDMQMITLHREDGEIGRRKVNLRKAIMRGQTL